MPYWVQKDFRMGLNTLDDERDIEPTAVDANGVMSPAESPFMENIDIIGKGSLLTSSGFEFVSSRGGGETGRVRALINYERDNTSANRQLIIGHDDDWLRITPASSVWTLIRDYGDTAPNLGGIIYKGTGGTRYAILGNDLAANITQRYDGTPPSVDIAAAPDGYIMEHFQGRLWIANMNSGTLSFTAVDDETNWAGGGTIGFNDIITGLKNEGDRLYVFTMRDVYTVRFNFQTDGTLQVVPQKEPFRRGTGCVSHKTIQPVYNNNYYLSLDGIQALGAEEQYIASDARAKTLSWKIKPTIEGLNPTQLNLCSGKYFRKRYYVSGPNGVDGFNSIIFVWNQDYQSWTVRTGLYVSDFAVFKDSNDKEWLYFGSSLEPALFRFNDLYSYQDSNGNSAGYRRTYRSKKFDMFRRMTRKRWYYLDITGSMAQNTTFQVKITVDGISFTSTIDSTSLETTPSGGFLGDNFLGNEFLGGGLGLGAIPFYRFRNRIYFPFSVRSGYEMQYEFTNNSAGQPWKIDFVGMKFDYEDDAKIDSKYQNNNLSPI